MDLIVVAAFAALGKHKVSWILLKSFKMLFTILTKYVLVSPFPLGPPPGRVLLHRRDGRDQVQDLSPQLGEDLLRQPARSGRRPAKGHRQGGHRQDQPADPEDAGPVRGEKRPSI